MRTLMRMASICSRIELHLIPQFHRRFSYLAVTSLKGTPQLFNESDELMPWLRKKTGLEISSVLAIGTSCYGRTLFASEPIEDGDCILNIPYTVHLTPDKIHPEVESLIDDDVGTISRLALVLLAEQKLGKNSDWFPYLYNLPHAANMHNTFLERWRENIIVVEVRTSLQLIMELMKPSLVFPHGWLQLDPVVVVGRKNF